MLLELKELYCRFCEDCFCCKDCRLKHENKAHKAEIIALEEKERIMSMCYICNGLDMPIHCVEKPSSDLLSHIRDYHLPLKCNKCDKVVYNIEELNEIGKCCAVGDKENEKPPNAAANMTNEVMGEEIQANNNNNKADHVNFEEKDEEALTPLSKINLRWRRKSKEFFLKNDDGAQQHISVEVAKNNPLKRSTSTPMQETFDSPLSIHISSIHCANSSSEQDVSLMNPQKSVKPKNASPKNAAKAQKSQSKNRRTVQNTPLRQIMTKSIQRAMVAQGQYRMGNLQQRRMTFDSSSSSQEPTVSLLKFQVEEMLQASFSAPLDLRLSPAIRRGNDNAKPMENDDKNTAEKPSEDKQQPVGCAIEINEVKIEHIEVVCNDNEVHSESSVAMLTNYKSCYSEKGTPKVPANNILKRTISFDSAGLMERTPAFLAAKKSRFENVKQQNEEDDSDSDDDESDDVFYTPYKFENSTTIQETTQSPSMIFGQKEKPKNIWSNLFTSVASAITNKPDRTSSSNSEKMWSLDFTKPKKMLKAAAEYFGKSKESEDVQVLKRRRTASTNSNNDVKTIGAGQVSSSPISKRRRIQPRKPIQRMRNSS